MKQKDFLVCLTREAELIGELLALLKSNYRIPSLGTNRLLAAKVASLHLKTR